MYKIHSIKSSDSISKLLARDPRYKIGVTNEWIRFDKRETVRNRQPVEQGNGDIRYATRCIGYVDIGLYKFAVIRSYIIRGLFVDREGVYKDHECIILEPVILLSDSTFFPSREHAVIDRIGITIEYNKDEDNLFEFKLHTNYIPIEIEGALEIDWQIVVEELAPALKREILEGEPMFEFA